jgi:hypothetical protein
MGWAMTGFMPTLSERNIRSLQRNHPDEFLGALRDIEALRKDTGLPFSTDEQRRLASLSILIAKGVVNEGVSKPPEPTTTTVSARKRRRKSKEAQPV